MMSTTRSSPSWSMRFRLITRTSSNEGMKRLGKLANVATTKIGMTLKISSFQITLTFSLLIIQAMTRVNLSDAKQRKAIENNIASRYEANFKS